MLQPPQQPTKVEGSESPVDPTKLPDELKGDCFKFFKSPAGQIFMQVLRARGVVKIVNGLTAHDLIRASALKEGYEAACAAVSDMIIESNPPEPEITRDEARERILTSPAD